MADLLDLDANIRRIMPEACKEGIVLSTPTELLQQWEIYATEYPPAPATCQQFSATYRALKENLQSRPYALGIALNIAEIVLLSCNGSKQQTSPEGKLVTLLQQLERVSRQPAALIPLANIATSTFLDFSEPEQYIETIINEMNAVSQ
jgi:hypothetical protein